MKMLILFCLLSAVATAGDRLYWGSVAVMIGGSVFDGAASYGGGEMNPLLRGGDRRFGVRGLAIKAGIAGGVILIEHLYGKRNRKPFTVVNFALGANYSILAVRTMYLRRQSYRRYK